MEFQGYNVSQERRIIELRQQLQTQRDIYQKARDQVRAEPLSAYWETELFFLLALAEGFRHDSRATVAVYYLAQITDRLKTALQPWRLCAEYDDLQTKLRQLETQRGE